MALKYKQSAFFFQKPDKSRHTYLRRNFYQHMYVIRANFRFYNLYLFPVAQLS